VVNGIVDTVRWVTVATRTMNANSKEIGAKPTVTVTGTSILSDGCDTDPRVGAVRMSNPLTMTTSEASPT